jgi:hypothetical protein
MSLEDGTRYIVPKRRLLTTRIRCMTSQKSDDLKDPKYSYLVVEFQSYLLSYE